LGLKFNVGQLCVDVKWKETESHFDDIKSAGIKVSDWGGKLQNRNEKTTRQSNTAHILEQYVQFLPQLDFISI